jgi:hypothetical protein
MIAALSPRLGARDDTCAPYYSLDLGAHVLNPGRGLPFTRFAQGG